MNLNLGDFMKNKVGFTLLELLVVVVIISILAAIALPQYRKAVLRTQLHKGIPLVESLYQAQQSYILTHGNFADNIDDLEVSVPVDKSCKKTQKKDTSEYSCNWGIISIADTVKNVQFRVPGELAYIHYIQDLKSGGLQRKAGEVWCFAKSGKDTAQKVCQEMGGQFGNSDSNWTRYKIR